MDRLRFTTTRFGRSLNMPVVRFHIANRPRVRRKVARSRSHCGRENFGRRAAGCRAQLEARLRQGKVRVDARARSYQSGQRLAELERGALGLTAKHRGEA